MEKYNAAITSPNTYLILSYSINAFNTLSAYVLSKDKNLILDLEAAKVARKCACKQILLIWFRKGETRIISYERTCVYQF